MKFFVPVRLNAIAGEGTRSKHCRRIDSHLAESALFVLCYESYSTPHTSESHVLLQEKKERKLQCVDQNMPEARVGPSCRFTSVICFWLALCPFVITKTVIHSVQAETSKAWVRFSSCHDVQNPVLSEAKKTNIRRKGRVEQLLIGSVSAVQRSSEMQPRLTARQFPNASMSPCRVNLSLGSWDNVFVLIFHRYCFCWLPSHACLWLWINRHLCGFVRSLRKWPGHCVRGINIGYVCICTPASTVPARSQNNLRLMHLRHIGERSRIIFWNVVGHWERTEAKILPNFDVCGLPLNVTRIVCGDVGLPITFCDASGVEKPHVCVLWHSVWEKLICFARIPSHLVSLHFRGACINVWFCRLKILPFLSSWTLCTLRSKLGTFQQKNLEKTNAF